MLKIKQYTFPKDNTILKNEKYGYNWPVVYLLHNKKEIYIGETYNLATRMRQHQDNPEKSIFNNMHMIADSDFNKSATLDIESSLIKYIAADGKYSVTNKNEGLVNSDYYQRQTYQERITSIWSKLRSLNIVQKELIQIENSDIFKFSPYKSLSEDQLEVVETIVQDIIYRDALNERGIYFINGLPGSGKTVLATYLAKYISQNEDIIQKRLAIVVSMTSLRKTLKKSFKHVSGLSSKTVIGPSELGIGKYDILLVDEAHRLRRRKGIMGLKSFDEKNKEFGLSSDGNELDWIFKSSRHIILFYDENQSVRPSDIDKSVFMSLEPAYKFTLNSQFRVKAGMEFVYYIRNIFNNSQKEKQSFENYEVSIVNDFSQFVNIIYGRDEEYGLSLITSGYSFKWVSKKDKSKSDIQIDGINLQWNTVASNFIYSKNASKEVGCIHTVQGYELNYVGLIIGEDIDYNFKTDTIFINPKKYFDRNGKVSTSADELTTYIKNIYVTLATRGIRGIYFYVMNKGMKEYLSRYFEII